MRVPLAILFSVCVIVGLGQLVRTDATEAVIEVPASAFVADMVPVDVPAAKSEKPAAKSEKPNSELPTPPPTDLAFNDSCPQCPTYQPPASAPSACDPVQTEVERGESRGRPVLGLVGGVVKAAARVVGRDRRAARRSARRGE